MSDDLRGPNAPSSSAGGLPGAGDLPYSSTDAGMANSTPPALPATPTHAPPPPIGALSGVAAGMGGVRGVLPPGGEQTATAGQDVRHRGWYWHWNTLITQYAPLLGLKGIGLLNSYTVWTDRREGSPHQGYAFPTQDAEGKFYGEGREELITLNKVLVALDLIAIHKEMVLRQDDRNRRWRVPHNFYRVKDPRDGLVLNLPAVVRVLELASRDRNVFRHIRHIFSPQFAPIDRTSIWHYLLPELRQLPLWQQLAERAERERRGGKRLLSLAGAEPPETIDASTSTIVATSDTDSPLSGDSGDNEALTFDNDRPSIVANDPRTDDVASVDADAPPKAPDVSDTTTIVSSIADEGTITVEPAPRPFVVPRHLTENQKQETREETSTSTTSTNTRESVSSIFEALAERDRRERQGAPPTAAAFPPTLPPDRFASTEQPLPPIPALPENGSVIVRALDVTEPTAHAIADQTATIADIEAALTMANGRPPSDMEISLLVQVARECDPAAHGQGYGPGTGLGWVLAAIWEAVNSGSQFVAPKRVAAICDRWAVEGFGSDHRANPNAPPVYADPPTWPMSSMSPEPESGSPPPIAITDSVSFTTLPAIDVAGSPAAIPGIATSDAEGRRLWEQVIHRLQGVLHPEALERWFGAARVTAIAQDRVTVTVPGADVALKLTSYRGLISRRMSEILGRTVDVIFQATHISTAPAAPPSDTVQQSTQVYSPPPVSDPASPWSWPAPTASGSFPSVPAESVAWPSRGDDVLPDPAAAPRGASLPGPSLHDFVVPPADLSSPATPGGRTNRQIWAMALQDLQTRISGATFAVWIKPAELLSVDPDGTLVIGARNRVQRERLERQYLADLTAVLGSILDRPVGVRIVVIGEGEQRVG